MQTIRFAIIGDQGVGKSNLLRRFYIGTYNKYNIPLDNHTMSEIMITTHGHINIEITEVHEEIPENCDGVIIMFDTQNLESFTNLQHHVKKAKLLTNNIVIIGNKVDLKYRTVKWKDIKKMAFRYKYYEYSCRSNYQLEKPIVYLLQQIYDDDFKFLEQPPIDPPEVLNIDELLKDPKFTNI